MKIKAPLYLLKWLSPLVLLSLWFLLFSPPSPHPHHSSTAHQKEKKVDTLSSSPTQISPLSPSLPPSLKYKKELTRTLLRGMPKETLIRIKHVRSFFFQGEIKDILLIETTLPNGYRNSYKASYSPRVGKITRTWGGGSNHRKNPRFTYRPKN